MDIIKKTNIDFISKRKAAYVGFFFLILAGLVAFSMRGRQNFGVDFVGGEMMNIEFSTGTDVSEIRDILGNLNIGYYSVQELGENGKSFIIKSGFGTIEKILGEFGSRYGSESFTIKGQSQVSPSMSTTLRNKALFAFIAGMIGILLYITIRFEFRFAVGATLAIFHDMLFVLAILAITRKQIDATVIAAFLTIAGFSVNDTVVIFDRIRENIRKHRGDDYTAVFNNSINETLSRTILTGLSTIVVVLCLFFLGGETLHVFSLSLLIGFIIGTYSSVFVATSMLIDWHKVQPHKCNV